MNTTNTRTSYFSGKEFEIVILLKREHAELTFQKFGFEKKTFTLTDDTLEFKVNFESRMLIINAEKRDEDILWFRKTTENE